MHKKLAGKMLLIYIPGIIILLAGMMTIMILVANGIIQDLAFTGLQEKTQRYAGLIATNIPNDTNASPDLNLIQKQIDEIQPSSANTQAEQLNRGYAFVVSAEGQILAHSGAQNSSAATVFDLASQNDKDELAQWLKDLPSNQSSYIRNIADIINARTSTWVYAPIGTSGLVLVLSAPDELILAKRSLFDQSALWLSLAVILLFSGLVIISTLKLTQPLNHLVQQADCMASGDLNIEVYNSGQDEIGQVAAALLKVNAHLKRVAEATRRVADGDLNFEMETLSEKDLLGQDFNRMIHKLQTLINELKIETNRLQEAGDILTQSSRQTGNAAAQISTTIQQVSQGVLASADSISRTASSIDEMTRSISGIANGAEEQASAVSQASQVTVKLSEVIQRVNGNASVVVSEAGRASEVARAGSEKVKETVKGMENIQTTVGLSAQKVKEMGARSEQITSIAEALDTIASQTNLLALNAAIEAARAGAHGKGFAVVADEVRKLADRASNSSHEIAAIIESMHVSVLEAVNTMDSGAREVENGVTRAHEAGQALLDIMEAVEAVIKRASGTVNATETMRKLSGELVAAMDSVSNVVEQNTSATVQMSSDSNLVSQSIENIASISEQNSAAVEEVGATAEQLSGEASELSNAAEKLSTMMVNVTDLISRFKV